MLKKNISTFLILSLSLIFLATPQRYFKYPKAASIYIIHSLKNFTFFLQSNVKIGTSSNEKYSEKIEELKKENEILRQENILLKNKILNLKKKILSLSELKKLPIDKIYQKIPADVIIKNDSSNWQKSMVINRGEKHSVKKGMPVVWGKAVVGEISETFKFTSRVKLITNPGLKIKAIVLPKNYEKEKINLKGREIGIVEGTSKKILRLKYISKNSKPKCGDYIVTSGSKNFPRSLIIGTIESVSSGFIKDIKIKPYVDLKSIESVIILKRKK